MSVVGDSDPECTDEIGVLLPSGGRLVETDGSTASSSGRDVVVLDWALDAATTPLVVVAAAPGCSAQTLSESIGLLQSAGVEVVVVEDAAGLVVARTVAMIVNEAVALVERGEASRADVDTAMTLGTGYPRGPLAWGEQIGPACVVSVLRHLHEAVPTGRYRVAPGAAAGRGVGVPARCLSPGPGRGRPAGPPTRSRRGRPRCSRATPRAARSGWSCSPPDPAAPWCG